jgi:membrane peptidoglycan carboxypeptidase
LSKDDQGSGTAAGSAGALGWTLPLSSKTGTTESHRSSGFVGFTNRYAAANYIFDDSNTPSGICSFPLRRCGTGDLYGGSEPARTWFEAMKPIATDFGDLHLPPTDPRYVDGAPSGQVPSLSGLNLVAARQRLKDAGFQVADQTTSVNSTEPYGAVVGTTPSGQTIPGSIITINTSNGIPPAPPAPPRPPVELETTGEPDSPPVGDANGPGSPPQVDSPVIPVPGLPPITAPTLEPPPPPPPPPPPEPPG